MRLIARMASDTSATVVNGRSDDLDSGAKRGWFLLGVRVTSAART